MDNYSQLSAKDLRAWKALLAYNSHVKNLLWEYHSSKLSIGAPNIDMFLCGAIIDCRVPVKNRSKMNLKAYPKVLFIEDLMKFPFLSLEKCKTEQ